MKPALKIILAELAWIMGGLLTVITLAIGSLHVTRIDPPERYTFILTAYLAVYSLVWGMFLWRRQRARMSAGHAAASCFAVFFASCVFLPFVPMAVDRSMTLFLMNEMNVSGKSEWSLEELRSEFAAGFICGHSAVEKRMVEQEIGGTIERTEAGRYRLTERGRFMIRNMQWLAEIFATPKPHRASDGACEQVMHAHFPQSKP